MALNFGLSVGSSEESVGGVSMRIIRKRGLNKGRSHEGREPRVHTEKEACSSLSCPWTDDDSDASHSSYYRAPQEGSPGLESPAVSGNNRFPERVCLISLMNYAWLCILELNKYEMK